MIREPLDVLAEPIPVQPLDRSHDLGMALRSNVVQQTAIGHLMGQRVLEGVLQLREERVS